MSQIILVNSAVGVNGYIKKNIFKTQNIHTPLCKALQYKRDHCDVTKPLVK